MFRWLVAAGAFALVGCSAAPEAQDRLPATNLVPELGPRQTFVGVWSLGLEMSKFNYCQRGAEFCRHLIFNSGGCWLQGIGEKPGQIEKLLGGRLEQGENLYVKFKGRETLKRGEYGHLGEYSCEIYGERLLSAERIPLE